ncbi:MAG: LysR family transcriptional regulator [Novosphingobium sp.]|nr:LysR family transcriptional regulator [Novosphingobium sp.]
MLDGVDAFVRVAERRSFRAAAKDLGVSPSAVSQQVKALEERAGVPLLVRTTRSVGLTEAGEIFLRRSGPALAELAAAFDETRNLGEPAGLLRLNMPKDVIPILIEPVLAEFCEAYPRIDLEIVTSDIPGNLIEEGYDAGVHLGEMLDNDTVGLRLTDPIRFVVVASPDYLEHHGRPRVLADLRDHSCIRMFARGESGTKWVFIEDGRPVTVSVTGRVVANDIGLCITAACKGLGLFFTAERLVADRIAQGQLEVVLPDHTPTSDGLYLHYPSRTHILPKLRVFIDFVSARLKR